MCPFPGRGVVIAVPERLRRRLPPARRIEWYPAFRDMRVRVLELAPDWSRARLLLPLNRRNRNPAGGMFGGCIAALADPVAALACVCRYPGLAVWTRELRVDFRREGRTDLELVFQFDTAQSACIAEDLRRRGRSTPRFEYGVYLADGRLAASIVSAVAIRPKGYAPAGASAHTPGQTGEGA
ncbi:MAG: PaaI family thioesterase [Chromatiales bacterium]